MASLIVELQAKVNVCFENLKILRSQQEHLDSLLRRQQLDLERLAAELDRLAKQERPA